MDWVCPKCGKLGFGPLGTLFSLDFAKKWRCQTCGYETELPRFPELPPVEPK